MRKIGIFYGSTTGNTEHVAALIAKALNIPDNQVHSAADINATLISEYDTLILGSSTWGSGELQDDWYNALDVLRDLDLSEYNIAFFGCGDSLSYSDTFCDAVGLMYESLKDTGATFIGQCPTDGYAFDDSAAVIDNMFIGLIIDEDNESNLTKERIDSWVKQII